MVEEVNPDRAALFAQRCEHGRLMYALCGCDGPDGTEIDRLYCEDCV